MSRNWPTDIHARIANDFGQRSAAACDQLAALDSVKESERVLRCVLHLAASEFEQLDALVRTALLDYRDIIWSAEYDTGELQLRDFAQPFDAL
jgi:hypothetical protein